MESRKTKIGVNSESDMKRAFAEHFDTDLGQKKLAEKKSILRTTSRRYRDKCLKTNLRFEVGVLPNGEDFPRLTSNYDVKKIPRQKKKQHFLHI